MAKDMIIEVTEKNAEVLAVFTSKTRVKIIDLLREGPMNIKEIAAALELSSPMVTKHIAMLEDAGIVRTSNLTGKHGMQKICEIAVETIMLTIERKHKEEISVSEYSVPVGLYTDYNVEPTCGLLSKEKMIGFMDDPRYFAIPEHIDAGLIWFSKGWVEYQLPNYLDADQKLVSISLSMELCSEAPIYNEQWPSTIEFELAGTNVGSWTCPGDFGNKKGVLTPKWWDLTQYGMLKTLVVNEVGTYMDGIIISKVNIGDLDIANGKRIPLRIICNDSTNHSGGINLFGKDFGNYPQDIIVKMEHM